MMTKVSPYSKETQACGPFDGSATSAATLADVRHDACRQAEPSEQGNSEACSGQAPTTATPDHSNTDVQIPLDREQIAQFLNANFPAYRAQVALRVLYDEDVWQRCTAALQTEDEIPERKELSGMQAKKQGRKRTSDSRSHDCQERQGSRRKLARSTVARKCDNVLCMATEDTTPMMRRGPNGLRTLCNACGLYWVHKGLMRVPRPATNDRVARLSGSNTPQPVKSAAGPGTPTVEACKATPNRPASAVTETVKPRTTFNQPDRQLSDRSTLNSRTIHSPFPPTGHGALPFAPKDPMFNNSPARDPSLELEPKFAFSGAPPTAACPAGAAILAPLLQQGPDVNLAMGDILGSGGLLSTFPFPLGTAEAFLSQLQSADFTALASSREDPMPSYEPGIDRASAGTVYSSQDESGFLQVMSSAAPQQQWASSCEEFMSQLLEHGYIGNV